MTGEDRRAVVGAEVERAREELVAAEHLLDGELPRIAIARVYFAVFHAIRALLYHAGFDPQSHRGVVQLFGLHFVRTGQYDSVALRIVTRLQKFREEADYGEGFSADAAWVRDELTAARVLVDRVLGELAAG